MKTKTKKLLQAIHKILERKLYDELSDYEKGAKDILNLLFCPEIVDDNLKELFE